MSAEDRYSTNLYQMFNCLVKYRAIVWQLTRQEVVGRYKGSVLGLAWSFFNPLIMLAIYTVVFSTIFQAKWSGGSESKTEFALVLFIGMIMHGVIAEALGKAPTLIIGNESYVKKIVFPLQVLPWVMMGATMFHALVSLTVWVLFYVLVNLTLNWTIIFLPLILFPLVLFALGTSWLFSSLGVYLRDIRQMTNVIVTMLQFLSPVFYSVTRIPEPYRFFMYLNPMTFIIEESRAVMVWGELPDFKGLLVLYIASLTFAWLGFSWFQKTKKGFADVL